MMFDGLTARLQGAFRKIAGYTRLSESNIAEAVREVRLALLEADVNYKVVKDFIEGVKEKAVGREALRAVLPGQQLIKIVHDDLVELMGGVAREMDLSSSPAVIMLVGLQGSGKTTTAAKLARRFKKKGRNPLLVPCDTKRAAAVEQLLALGRQFGETVFEPGDGTDAVKIAANSVKYARDQGFDTVILDTAGRLHIDDELMNELRAMKKRLSPREVLLVADAMTGQDAVNIASAFDEVLDISGAILTKLDGDTRGGAALSIKAVSGKPIKFVGVGEKVDDLELFHPDRMATRILGMGDVVTLVEKAQEVMDQEQAEELQRKLRKHGLDLEDYLTQMQSVRKMGSLDSVLKMMPGFDQLKGLAPAEEELKRVEAIIQSMTPVERRNPRILDGSRKRRIATGSGTSVQEVNRLLKGFEQAKKVIKKMGKFQKGLMKVGGFSWQ
ncbi:signal recognition particle protein [bacterium]|nr:signal recognition particle protein [bacterium]